MDKSQFLHRKLPLQSRSQATFEAILTATIRVLDQHQGAFTTTQIAKVAGVSVGSLYQYFPNKQAIVAKLIEIHAMESLKRMRATLDAVQSQYIEDYIEPVIAYIVNFYYERRYVLQFMYRHIFEVKQADIHRNVKVEATRIMLETIRERGLKTNANVEETLALCTNAVVGVLDQYIQYEMDLFDKDKLTQQLKDFLLPLLRPH